MQTNFERCLSEVLQHEGGWADDPHDPGGATMRGITIGTFTPETFAWGGRQAFHGRHEPSLEQIRRME